MEEKTCTQSTKTIALKKGQWNWYWLVGINMEKRLFMVVEVVNDSIVVDALDGDYVVDEETMHITGSKERTFWLQLANLLSQMTSPIGWIQDLIVEHGKVEGQTQPDGVGWLHLGAGHFKRFLVWSLRVVHYAFQGEFEGNDGRESAQSKDVGSRGNDKGGMKQRNIGRGKKKQKERKLVSESSTNGPVWRVGRLSQVNSESRNRRPRSWEPNPAGLDALAAFWPCWFRTHLGKPFENRRQQLQDFNNKKKKNATVH